jgi:ribosomal protein L32E
MVEEKSKTKKRKVPLFLRKDWHKKIKLGKGVKKNQKWRGAKGIQNKIRLGRRGHSTRPKIGYSQPTEIRGKIKGQDFTRVENLREMESLKKGDAIMVAKIGKKKKDLILKEAEKKGFLVLNKYPKEKKE